MCALWFECGGLVKLFKRSAACRARAELHRRTRRTIMPLLVQCSEETIRRARRAFHRSYGPSIVGINDHANRNLVRTRAGTSNPCLGSHRATTADVGVTSGRRSPAQQERRLGRHPDSPTAGTSEIGASRKLVASLGIAASYGHRPCVPRYSL